MNRLHEVVQKLRSGSESSDKGSSFPLSEDETGSGGSKTGKTGLVASPDSIFTTSEASQPLNPSLLATGHGHGGSTRSRPWSGFLPDLSFPSTKIPSSASASGDLFSIGSDQTQPSCQQASTTTTTTTTATATNNNASTTATTTAATATPTTTPLPNQDNGATGSVGGGGGGGGGGSTEEVMKMVTEHRQLLQQHPYPFTAERARSYSKSKKKQPPGTFEYTIKDRDTLASVAAHYELTPSELMKVNRLISRTIFAGQVLFIPDPSYVTPDPAPTRPVPVTNPDLDPRPKVDVPLTSLGDRSPSSVPGHVIKLSSPPDTPSTPGAPTTVTQQLSKEEEEQDRECHQKFVKIRSRRILEDGDNIRKENFGTLTCKGTLLVTPNAIMFDPDVNDDYVLSNGGQAKFSAVIYMENIKGAVLLPDTSSRFFWRQPEELRGKSPKPEVYRPDKDAQDSPDGSRPAPGDVPDGLRVPPDGCSGLDERVKARASPEGSGSPHADKGGGRMSEELENMKEFSQSYGMSISTPGRTSEEIASTFTSDPSPSIVLQKHLSRSSELAVSEISLFEDSLHSKTFGETRDFGPHMGLSSSEMIRNDSTSSQSNQMVHSPGIYSPGMEHIVNNGGGSNGGGQAGGLNTPTQGFAPVFFTDRSPSSAIAAPKPVPGQKAGGILLSSSLTHQPHPQTDNGSGDTDSSVNSHNIQRDASGTAPDVSTVQNATGSSSVNATAPVHSSSPESLSQSFQNLKISHHHHHSPNASSAPHDGNATSTTTTSTATTMPFDSTDGATPIPNPTGTSRAPPSSIPSTHSSSFSPLRNPAQHISSFINYTTGFFKAGEGNGGGGSGGNHSNNTSSNNKASSLPLSVDEPCGGLGAGSNGGTPKSAISTSSKIGKGLSAFPFPASLIPEAISSNFPSFMSSSQTGSMPSTAPSGNSFVSSTRSEELTSSLGPPLSSYLPRSDSPQFEDPPMYLQIRVGIPADAENLPRRPHAIVKRVKGRLLEEYWFLIPRSTRNKVYKFIIDWRPEVYGDQEQCKKREHFFYDTRDVMHLIQPIGMPKSPNSAEERLNIIDDHFTMDDSWEILSHLDADPHNIFIDKTPQDDLNLPEFINGPSAILTPQHVVKLMSALPVNMSVGYNWTLVFSTSRHGFSLSQLYREMRGMEPELPVVLCLTDTDQNVFGAYLSTTIRISETFYGSGSTFLYTFYPEFKHFHWEGDNFYFMNGCKDSFGVGSGEGLFGLWLDGDLDKGRSHRCTTFHNDILTPKEDFHIVHVEAWQLTD